MGGTVSLSRVQSKGSIADKQGLRLKSPGRYWEEPYACHRVPRSDEDVRARMHSYNKGVPLTPGEFPEASANYDAACFQLTKQMFHPAVGILGARAKLAEVLSKFDLEPIGLIP